MADGNSLPDYSSNDPCPVAAQDQVRAALALARDIGLFGIGLRTHRYVFAGSHRHRAGNEPGNSCDENILRLGGGRSDPTMRLAVETIPSLAPITAALSQPMRLTRWVSECSSALLMVRRCPLRFSPPDSVGNEEIKAEFRLRRNFSAGRVRLPRHQRNRSKDSQQCIQRPNAI